MKNVYQLYMLLTLNLEARHFLNLNEKLSKYITQECKIKDLLLKKLFFMIDYLLCSSIQYKSNVIVLKIMRLK